MTGPVVLRTLVQATALLAVAAIVQAGFRRRGSAAARHLVWTCSLAALLALPIAEAALPRWTVEIPVAATVAAAGPGVKQTASAPASAFAGTPTLFDTGYVGDAGLTTQDVRLEPRAARPMPRARWGFAIALLYVAGVVLLLLRVAVETFVLRRLARESRPIKDADWQRVLAEATARLSIARGVRLLRNPRDVIPLTFGMLRPAVIVPASADAWSEARRRAVLLHELAHIARHDCATQLLGAVACAMYWPHPGVWMAARRMRRERELACDDRVVSAGTEPRAYAGDLLELARSLGSAPAPVTALAIARKASTGELENRLVAVLDGARNRAALTRVRGVLAVAASMVVLVPMAGLRAAVVPSSRSIIQDPPGFTGTWEVRVSDDGARASVGFRTGHSSHSMTLPTARLEQLAGMRIPASGAVHFPFKRDAGTFTIDGVCRVNVCSGTYLFTPDPAFAAVLAKRGIDAPSAAEQLAMAMQDVGLAYLDELAKDGYSKPDIHGLVRAAQHGVSLEYVREMAALGYRLGRLEGLVMLRDHGIDPTYVREMAANGFDRLSTDDLLRARDHGVDPPYLKGMRDFGFRSVDLAGFIGLRNHGIDPSYIAGMAAQGFRNLSIPELLNARNHGIDPEYIRGMTQLGYRWTLPEMLEARSHGVDPTYVEGLKAEGYAGLTLDTLVRMRAHGVDPDYIKRVQQKGVGYLTPDQLIDRRDHGTDDPTVAARQTLTALQSLWKSMAAQLGR